MDRLRGKSEATREHYSVGLALVVTLIIALVWITTLPGRFSAGEDNLTYDSNEGSQNVSASVLDSILGKDLREELSDNRLNGLGFKEDSPYNILRPQEE